MIKKRIVGGALAALVTAGLLFGGATAASAACDGEDVMFTYSRSISSGGDTVYVYEGGGVTHYDSNYRGRTFTSRVCF